MARPHLQDGIDVLERLYESHREDSRVASEIVEELKHRTTERARRLADRIASERVPRQEKRSAPDDSYDVAAAMPDAGASHPAAASPSSQVPPIQPDFSVDDREVEKALLALEAAPSAEDSASKDSPLSILSAWTALEVLAPLSYKDPAKLAGDDRSCVAQIGNGSLPWERGETSRPKRKLFYLVVLGELNLDTTMADLLRQFGDNDEMPKRQGTRAPIAMAIVDRNGMLVGEDSVVVSSFAWGVPVVLRGKMGALARWSDAESILRTAIYRRLSRFDADGQALPLNQGTINAGHAWLKEILGLPGHHVIAPSFVVRLYQYYRLSSPPEMPLLNSFFLSDLAKARQMVDAGNCPMALKRFLGICKPEQSSDLLADNSRIAELVAPSRFPLARWPSRGGHPLVTLQQAAVNTARTELPNGKEGVLAVNGPPGTGKTTLLRDLVAHCVTSRAGRLVKFADPEKAFIQTGEQIKVGDGAFLRLYKLSDDIKGYELLVASSNNKAVENVSKELPAGKSIEPGLKYFSSVAKIVCGDPDATAIADEPWGLISAVLGNGANRAAFQQAFWWHTDFGFPIYLKAARGQDVTREVVDGEGRPPRKELPPIVGIEKPLNGDAALQQWKTVCRTFHSQQRSIEERLAKLEEARGLPSKVARTGAEVEQLRTKQTAARQDVSAADEAHNRAARAATEAKAVATNTERHLTATHASRPGFFARLFRTASYRRWLYELSIAESQHQEAIQTYRGAQSIFSDATGRLKQCSEALRNIEKQLSEAEQLLSALKTMLQDARARIGDRFVDSQFFSKGHTAWNLAAPWLDDQLHAEREKLFAAALDVHKAFITVAAQKVQHNLGVLMTAMQAGAFKDQGKRQYLADLWSTLFLVIPVVSTTFASVDRMLGDMGAGAFGWLLIDEAGQATPQACVGALMRAQRAIVVGDPLQIPPVVTIPEKLLNSIAQYYRVSQDTWCAPAASVQTLADAATNIKAHFSTSTGSREVGLPLLVHRRCQDPMFSVSNVVAYDGQMVQAAGADKVGPVGRTLGTSAWFDVQGDATSKWCPAEGQAVLALLRKLAATGEKNPDIYIITPFRIVAHEMRQLLRAEPKLFLAFGVEENTWLNERVGTIHTFQGKEAEAVVAILGAPTASQVGARRWASSTPNIVNVMVSRAKSRLYVVGSHAAWSGVGYFAELARRIPLPGVI